MSQPEPTTNHMRPGNFRSLRWKLTLPLLLVIIPIAMLATYLITDGVARGIRDAQLSELISNAHAISEQAITLGNNQRREADRIAFTQNISQLIALGNEPALQAMARPLAAAGDLDYVFLGTASGQELVGLQRKFGSIGYEASQGAALNQLAFVGSVLSGKQPGASGVVRIGNRYALLTAAPIWRDNQLMGICVVGITLDRAIQSLQGSTFSQLAIYGPDGGLLGTSLAADSAPTDPSILSLSPGVQQQALAADNYVPIQDIQASQTLYQAAYVPFVVDSSVLGVVGLLQPNTVWYATDASRQLLSLAFSGMAAVVMIVAFIVVSLALQRLERITRTAHALASGDLLVRSNVQGADEIGELGVAVDTFAQRVQQRQDSLEALLREQRQESARLLAVLESIPDGIIVQDLDGRVVLMNDGARKLLGSQRVFRSSPLNELTAVVTDTLGEALAPGIYTLGEAQRVPLDGKVLHAQAAAILSFTEEKRIGTVIVLRDVTDDVRREQAREALLTEVAREAGAPLAEAQRKGPDAALEEFISEVNRNAIALQRLIAEIRDLSTLDSRSLRQSQQALSAEMLVWNLVREWQPAASAARVTLHAVILRRDLLVLGEERRLRWAIGNLIDNAIKYTQAGGHVTIMLRAADDEQHAEFSMKDTGVGISPADLPHVFTRFYRGKPIARNGQVIQTPGSGQGLFIARRVIEAHGGTLDLTSAVGQGTEVIFRLPLTANITMDLNSQRQESASELEQIERTALHDAPRPVDPSSSTQ